MEIIISVVGAGACVGVALFGLCMYCAKCHPSCSRSRERRRRNALLSTCTTVRFSNRNNREPNIPNETCPICLDDFRNREHVTLTPCRHGYHRNCLIESLGVNPLCPVCKSVVLRTTSPNSGHTAEGTPLLA